MHGVSRAWDIRTGAWTEPELDLVPLALRSGERAVDVGANYGLYTYHLSRAVGPDGQVLAFEPVPPTFETLRLVMRLLRVRNAKLVQKGVSDRCGRMAMEVPVHPTGDLATRLAYLRGRKDGVGSTPTLPVGDSHEIICDVVRLDDEVEATGAIAFVKIDIEGAEFWALRGARVLLERSKPTVLCEINPRFLGGFGIELAELIGLLRAHGYRMHKYDRGRHRLLDFGDGKITEGNYVFVHPSRASRFAALYV